MDLRDDQAVGSKEESADLLAFAFTAYYKLLTRYHFTCCRRRTASNTQKQTAVNPIFDNVGQAQQSEQHVEKDYSRRSNQLKSGQAGAGGSIAAVLGQSADIISLVEDEELKNRVDEE